MVYKPIREKLCNHNNQDKVVKATDMKFKRTNGICINGISGWVYLFSMTKLGASITGFV